jgi:hypothetical protein
MMSKKKNTKDTFGEVFTPPPLIQELLDHLPKRVWTDSTLQWLDPCAGQGNFLDEILPRLMEGLASKFPDTTARRRHILQHMVTQIELNPANVRILRRKYPLQESSHRILSGDFLEQLPSDTKNDKTKNVPQTYDIIVANPPYQSPKNTTYKGSVGNRTLWDAFVKQALQQSTPRTGILGFITPANWRRPDHELWTTLRERLLYLHIYGKSAGKEWFGVQTRFDVYVFQEKARPSHQHQQPIPLLVDEMGERYEKSIVPWKWPFLPNGMYRIIQPLLTYDPAAGFHVIHDSSTYDARKLTRRATTAHPYPVVHTLTQAGMGLRYAATKDSSQFGVAKVILNVNEKQYPVNDWQGKYGMSQLSFGLPIRSRAEGDRLVACIQSPMFQEIVKLTKWGSFQTDQRMFRYFRRDKFCQVVGHSTHGTTKKNNHQTSRKNVTKKNKP